MTTIVYDKPVTDLIAGLNATGHVTHTKFNKTSVTFHHNGGRLSHQGVLNVWKTRPASAHFDVDANGALAQYVHVNEYAWACGNTRGNQTSISIEMCNSTLSPTWQVAEVTWKSAARLAGWLFANVIKAAPTKSNVLFHHNWLATECAGPYMDAQYNDLLAEVQKAYSAFKGTKPTPAPSPSGDPEWIFGTKTTLAAQSYFRARIKDGKISAQWTGNKRHMPPDHFPTVQWLAKPPYGSQLIQLMQLKWGVKPDGIFGDKTARAGQKWLGVEQDGIWGDKTIEAFCRKIGMVK